jgi:hypothetical protein
MFMELFLAGCSGLVFQPAPVVPTNSPLPYSAKVRLSQVEAYLVKPGATMIADPHIENHVTGVSKQLPRKGQEGLGESYCRISRGPKNLHVPLNG